jgi:hypothetical protein
MQGTLGVGLRPGDHFECGLDDCPPAARFEYVVRSIEVGGFVCQRRGQSDFIPIQNMHHVKMRRPPKRVTILIRGECFRSGGHQSRVQGGRTGEQLRAIRSIFRVRLCH